MDYLPSGGCRAVEESGSLVSLERHFRIEGLSSGTTAELVDYARGALDTAGYTYGSAPSWAPGLFLLERDIQAANETVQAVTGTLRYVPIGVEEDSFRFHVYSGVQQKQTQNDRFGFPLEVSHTFPVDDPDFPDETQTQIANASFFEPQLRLSAVGILSRWIPVFESSIWIGAVNSTYWVGGAPGTWLCTSADAKPVYLTTSSRRWRFSFEFQYAIDGWNPTVYFQDQRTGRPPENLVAGTGVYTANLYRGLDFRRLFA